MTSEELQKMVEEQNKEINKFLQNDDPINGYSPVGNSAKPSNSGVCPICNRLVPLSDLENHVNGCLDAGPEETPLRNNQAKKAQPQQQPFRDPPKNEEGSDEYLVEQKKSLEFWEKKARQEEEDRKMALQMMEIEKKEPQEKKNPVQEDEDRKLAIKLMEQDKVRTNNSVEEDRKIALMILEQEKQRERELKRLPEEQDQKLAKILQQMVHKKKETILLK